MTQNILMIVAVRRYAGVRVDALPAGLLARRAKAARVPFT